MASLEFLMAAAIAGQEVGPPPVSHPAPGTAKLLGLTGFRGGLNSLVSHKEKLYAGDSGGNFYSLDDETYQATRLGDIGSDISGLTSDGTTIWGSQNISGGRGLVKIDPDVPSSTRVGNFGTDIQGLAYGNNTLFGVGSVWPQTGVYTINQTTGAATRNGLVTSINERGPGAFAFFDPKFYVAGWGNVVLYDVNPTTAAGARVGAVNNFGLTQDSAIPQSPENDPAGMTVHKGMLVMLGKRTGGIYQIGPVGTGPGVLVPTYSLDSFSYTQSALPSRVPLSEETAVTGWTLNNNQITGPGSDEYNLSISGNMSIRIFDSGSSFGQDRYGIRVRDRNSTLLTLSSSALNLRGGGTFSFRFSGDAKFTPTNNYIYVDHFVARSIGQRTTVSITFSATQLTFTK